MTEFRRLAIPDVLEIVPTRFQDHRGYFSEVYKRTAFEAEGLRVDWVQDNQSGSAHAGTVRGLHYQVPPVAQAKLVRTVRGAIFDVAVDLRKGSPTYGGWVGCELTSEKANQMFVPIGFAHGFMTLVADTEVLYKVSAPYSVEHERAMLWDDPDIAIAWPLPSAAVVLSDKDRRAPRFADLDPPFEGER
jgi:dTDP-4-dehydrorhamnose 3,5-epimerase